MLNTLYIGKSRKVHYAVSAVPAVLGSVVAVLSYLRFLPVNIIIAVIYALIMISVSASIAFMPKFKVSSMLEHLELRLPHLILRLRTLIMAGESPLEAFLSAASEVKSPLLDYLIKQVALGVTPEEAISELQGVLKNKPVLDTLKRIVLSLGMGEEAINYLKEEFDAVMAERESGLRKAIESLSVIVEMYMSIGVFFPVIAIVMLASLSILGSGFDINALIALLIFVAIPLFSAFSAVMAKKIVERALL